MLLGKQSFLHTLFLENEAQINKNNYRTMVFLCQNKSVCQKLARPARNENQPKKRYTPFLHEFLQFSLSFDAFFPSLSLALSPQHDPQKTAYK